MAPKDDLINAALGYGFANNQGFDEEACNNSLCSTLRGVDCVLKENTKTKCEYKRFTTNAQFICNGEFIKKNQVPNWTREHKYIDLAYLTNVNGQKNPVASLLAEVKIWKTCQNGGAFNPKLPGHEYPFVFLGGSLNSGKFGVDSCLLNKREKELQNIEKDPPTYPKTDGKLAAIQGNLCCFQPINGGGHIIATDADEGQLFKDFVKMLKYGSGKYDMLQVLYIVSENNSWAHVHNQKYILNKLEHLFQEFYKIAQKSRQFTVYKYHDFTSIIPFKPKTGSLCFPTATVHFGDPKIQHEHDITRLVIEWNYPVSVADETDGAGTNVGIEIPIFSECLEGCTCRQPEAADNETAENKNKKKIV